MKKSIVITGASGLVGSNLLATLNQDWSVIAISRTKDRLPLDNPLLEHSKLDLSSSWNTASLPETIDAVIHLAQSEHFREFPEFSENVFQVNTVTTLKLLDYARKAGAKTFIFASSGGIYGHGNQEFSEDLEICHKRDLGFYLGTKLCSEILAESYTPFMNIIVLRFFFLYGTGQKSTMLIPRLVKSVLEGKPITLHGEDGIRLNPTHVSDAVNSIIKALELEGSHKINVAGPEILSLRQIGEIIGQTVNKEPQFTVQLDSQPRHLVGDIHKMSDLLGAPKIKFQDGLKLLLGTSND